ncbi:hypothetical protein [Kitasatospora sp. NPDC092286]|uniref:hypothetical protein n=1 Tax=Kitasatospora sp. NPDC092286 TaxID=3364087 RepID=UPI0038195268
MHSRLLTAVRTERNPGRSGLLWLLDCAFRYAVVFMIGWTLISLTAPRRYDPAQSETGGRLDLWNSFTGYMKYGPGMLLLVGGSTLILLALMAKLRRSPSPGDLRAVAIMVLMLPVVFILPVGTGAMLAIQVGVQAFFVMVLIPVGSR